MGGGELMVCGVLLAEKEYVLLQLFLAEEIFGGGAVGAIADKDELCGHLGTHQRKNLHTISHVLHWTEVREVHENWLGVGGPLRAQIRGVGARIEVAVHKVGDDVDGALDVEFLERLRQQIVGDGGHAVALFDGKAGDGEIAAVAADEGNVGAMQRGDKGQAAGRGHRAGQQRADGMRNGVVNMQMSRDSDSKTSSIFVARASVYGG